MGSIGLDQDTVPSPSSIGTDNFEKVADQCKWPRQNERGYKIQEEVFAHERPIRVIHIGAGISGICLAKLLPEMLNNASLVCYDKNSDIGGTWLENRYVVDGWGCDQFFGANCRHEISWLRVRHSLGQLSGKLWCETSGVPLLKRFSSRGQEIPTGRTFTLMPKRSGSICGMWLISTA